MERHIRGDKTLNRGGPGSRGGGWSGVAITLLVIGLIGGLNWGLIGLFNWNLVAAIFGTGALARVLYVIVGLCSAAALFFLPRLRVAEGKRAEASVTTTEPRRTEIRP